MWFVGVSLSGCAVSYSPADPLSLDRRAAASFLREASASTGVGGPLSKASLLLLLLLLLRPPRPLNHAAARLLSGCLRNVPVAALSAPDTW